MTWTKLSFFSAKSYRSASDSSSSTSCHRHVSWTRLQNLDGIWTVDFGLNKAPNRRVTLANVSPLASISTRTTRNFPGTAGPSRSATSSFLCNRPRFSFRKPSAKPKTCASTIAIRCPSPRQCNPNQEATSFPQRTSQLQALNIVQWWRALINLINRSLLRLMYYEAVFYAVEFFYTLSGKIDFTC